MLDPRMVVDSKKVVEVRAEAPEEVDDIVVTFANGGKLYIQAKESVSKANDRTSVLGKVWRDFEEQFNDEKEEVLINDTDEEVQSQVGNFLYDIKKHPGLSRDVCAFVLDFAESKSVVHSGYELGQVL